MANPQPDKFTRISNELMEEFSKINLSSYETRVLMAILRKTYGWQKKEDWISFSQFRELTNLLDPHISRSLKKLVSRKIVTHTGKLFGLNKDYEQWQKLPKLVSGVTQTGKKKLPKLVDTKESKETITKEIIPTVLVAKPQYGNEELNKLIEFGKQNTFPLQGTLRMNRNCASNLLKKFGLEKSKWLVVAAVECRGKPYSPSISDFNQLYKKTGDLITYYAKNNKKGKVVNYDK